MSVPLDDGVGLYDEVGHALFVLNVGATAIWDECDGVSTVDDIVTTLSESHGADPAVVGHDVKRTLHELARHGLVTDSAGGAGTTSGVSEEASGVSEESS